MTSERNAPNMKHAFSDKEKMDAFDEIASCYYEKNFGSMSKTDYETMLFKIYLNHLKKNNLRTDDYSISRALGITQSKVRNLKIRNELQEDELDDSWKEEFAACVGNALYDKDKRLVKVIIPEVTVMMELRHFMEENRWYDEYQLNPKLFQCPLDFFLPLCEQIGGVTLTLDPSAKKKLSELKKQASDKEKTAIEQILTGALQDGFKELAWTGTTAIVVKALELLPFGGVAGKIITGLITVLRKSGKLDEFQ